MFAFCIDQEAGSKKKKGMGADSVMSMARMFQAGHVPGSSLSDLQEDGLLAKKQAYYSAFLGGSAQNKTGAKLAATSQANLMARAGRAKGMHRDGARPKPHSDMRLVDGFRNLGRLGRD